MTEQWIIEAKFNETCEKAKARSLEFACTVHVYAILGREQGIPAVIGFGVSDWYDGATVATYTDGRGE